MTPTPEEILMTLRSMGDMPDERSDDEKHRAALSKAKALANALDAAIEISDA